MKKPIRVAIIGVGNCAKSLIEGIEFYKNNPNETKGLMNPKIGNYVPVDVEFVAAFDVDKRKVGKPLHLAIMQEPNNTMKLAEVPDLNVTVLRGPTEDSIIPEMRDYFIFESEKEPVNIEQILRESKAEIVLNYLPSGSDKATYKYAEHALGAGCDFINCMTTPISKDDYWRNKFSEKGLVLMGDDIKSQCGATIANRVLLNMLANRGIKINMSDQTNFGGNADHYNLHFRPESKEESKESALCSVIGEGDQKPVARMIYTAENYDHKRASIYIQGEIFGGAPLSLQLLLDDEDSPNSAGVVVDAIRLARLSRDRNELEKIEQINATLFKHPYRQLMESEAYETLKEFCSSK